MKVNFEIENNIIMGWRTIPLDEATSVEVDEKTLSFISDNIGCIDINYHIINELVSKREKLARIEELKHLLATTDYMAIKYAERAITEYDYIDTRKVRQEWRDEINKLESELDGNTGSNK